MPLQKTMSLYPLNNSVTQTSYSHKISLLNDMGDNAHRPHFLIHVHKDNTHTVIQEFLADN